MTRFLHVGKSKADQILSLLVESGFIYCLFWVCSASCFLGLLPNWGRSERSSIQIPQVITFFDWTPRTNQTLYYGMKILDAFADQISGMYPTLIIVIVNLRYTIQWEEADSHVSIPATRRGARDNISTMCFANPSSFEHNGGAHAVAVRLGDSGVTAETMSPGREESKTAFKEV
jgi:hypothetical protein